MLFIKENNTMFLLKASCPWFSLYCKLMSLRFEILFGMRDHNSLQKFLTRSECHKFCKDSVQRVVYFLYADGWDRLNMFDDDSHKPNLNYVIQDSVDLPIPWLKWHSFSLRLLGCPRSSSGARIWVTAAIETSLGLIPIRVFSVGVLF